MSIRLLISFRIRLLAEGIGALLEGEEAIEIVGVASNKDDLFGGLVLDPDIILADTLAWNTLNSESECVKGKKVLLLADGHESSLNYLNLQESISSGLVGLVAVDSDAVLLKKAISKIISGDLWFDRDTMEKSFHLYDRRRNLNLTKREVEVLHCVSSGYTNKQTAQKLCISEQTVKSHCNHLFKKFGVPNRIKLVLCAQEYASGEFLWPGSV